MADSTLEDNLNEPSEAQKRITQLSGTVKTVSDERDTERASREAAEAKASEAERERDFYQGFSDVVATNPSAKDHKDEILEKVRGGYTVEDATYAVLGKAGKLGTPEPAYESPAGGSAATAIPQGGTKSVSEMSRDEKRQALVEAEARGDIGIS